MATACVMIGDACDGPAKAETCGAAKLDGEWKWHFSLNEVRERGEAESRGGEASRGEP